MAAHCQSNQAPELNRPDTGNASMTRDDPPAKAHAQLDELIEQGEISRKEWSR
jgi:hypothetical protein